MPKNALKDLRKELVRKIIPVAAVVIALYLAIGVIIAGLVTKIAIMLFRSQ
ncbi:hypothetical protein [Bartonella machadoae]|uniref:hypothetical protein n=1 Tax=Bartonella machadoae TaxID=2893471 RepID=UPI0027E3114D|nr:hypothetical protein [Bartonella machadoae]